MRNPSAAVPPLAWEEPGERGFFSRLIRTLGSAFRPVMTAPAMARSTIAPAVGFALLTALLPALLRGVIPFTETMRFGPLFRVSLIGEPTDVEIVADLFRALGLSAFLTLVTFVGLALPYVSLSKAYGDKYAGDAAMRVMLYRAWLVPLTMSGLLMSVGAWALPSEPPALLLLAIQLLDLVPLILLVSSMRATVRLAGGVSALKSYIVIMVPIVVMVAATLVMVQVLAPWLPSA